MDRSGESSVLIAPAGPSIVAFPVEPNDFDQGRLHRLPLQSVPLVGRENDIQTACKILDRSDVRVLTFVGAAGVGKTRLASEVAARLSETFEDGAWFVDLTPISDSSLVAARIARALGLGDFEGRVLTDLLHDRLGNRQILLFVDNFERVLAAAPVIAGILARCPRTKVLATSRVALHVSWEHLFPVGPLTVPTPAQRKSISTLAGVSAVKLFVTRARAVRPDFTLNADNAPAVADICALLEGFPLGINLAAAHCDVLPPREILHGLEHSAIDLLSGGAVDEPERHQSLRAAIDWSHDLLSPDEQRLFRRLSVFRGGFTPAQVETICNASRDGLTPAEHVLGALARHHLLEVDASDANEQRYRLRVVFREYASERLALSGETDWICREHAAYFLVIAEAAEAKLSTPETVAWLDRLEREHQNLRGALQWAVERHEAVIGLRLGAALWRFWSMRGCLSEGRDWLRRVLALVDAGATVAESREPPGRERGRALHGAACLARQQGDYLTARGEHEESLAILRELSDPSAIAHGTFELGVTTFYQGDLVGAKAAYEESLAGFRATEDRQGIGHVVFRLANLEHLRGEYQSALRLHEESLAILRERGDERAIADVLFNIGYIAADRGDTVRARVHLVESLSLMLRLGDYRGIAWVLEGFAGLLPAMDATRAAQLFGAASALREAIGARMPPAGQAHYAQMTEPARRALGGEAWTVAWNDARSLTLDAAIALALAECSSGAPNLPTPGEPVSTHLSRRELEILRFVACGCSNKRIAHDLMLSVRTVECHVANLYLKIGAHRRFEAIEYAHDAGLVA